MQNLAVSVLGGLAGMVLTGLHYRHTADSVARVVGYPFSVFAAPVLFALLLFTISAVPQKLRPKWKSGLWRLVIMIIVSYTPTLVFLIAADS